MSTSTSKAVQLNSQNAGFPGEGVFGHVDLAVAAVADQFPAEPAVASALPTASATRWGTGCASGVALSIDRLSGSTPPHITAT